MARRLDPAYVLEPAAAYQQLIQNASLSRDYLTSVRNQLTEWFLAGADTELLLHLYAQVIDQLLQSVWQAQRCPENIPITLLAVGGYGRGQLHLHSDIDIAFIIADTVTAQPEYLKKIQNFMRTLWDSRLTIGHSVRTLSETWQQAKQDSTILTALLESRLISGNTELAHTLQKKLYTVCSIDVFMQQKLAEYQTRLARYALPPYTLEPNIKCSPGGQRDIQLVEWLVNFCYQTTDAHALKQVFQENELQDWLKIKKYLNNVRFALHTQHTKANDQLLFDQQLQIARLFSEEGETNNQAVSNFMRRYFKYTNRCRQLVSRALQQLQTKQSTPAESVELDYTLTEKTLQEKPWSIFELFAIFSEQTHPLKINTATQRLLDKCSLYLPEHAYQDKHYHTFFLRILRSMNVTDTLKLMHDYHVLGKYIPLFSHVTGMMQYDLFHAHPVDTHTLTLVQQLENLIKGTNAHTFNLGASIAKQVPKPELLYLAGFFHDIGKGQNGHHEEIGAIAVRDFCLQHGYSTEESELVSWLVLNHLLLSQVAQHQDITNPAVIKAFAEKVGNPLTLIYLYLLTIADIYATNAKLWTGWRISLIDNLFKESFTFLSQPAELQATSDIVDKKRQAALALLDNTFHAPALQLWQDFNPDYFLTYTPAQLAEQTKLLLAESTAPLVAIQSHISQNATEIFIYAVQKPELFFAITHILDKLQLSVVAAHIHTTHTQHSLATYIVFQRGNKPLEDKKHIERVQQRLLAQLKNIDITSPALQVLPNRLKTFNYPTKIEFELDIHTNNTLLRLFTADRSGLLANIAHIFYQEGVQVQRAQINTLAERAEDIFWLLNNQCLPLTLEQQNQLLLKLHQAFDGN